MLYSSVNPSVTALQWGRQHEHQYCQILGSDLTLISAGFFVGKCGSSPDGIVTDVAGQLVKFVEVKCPFRARDKTVKQASMDDKSFCCGIVNNTPCLRSDHDYYYQIQGQMAITGIHTPRAHCAIYRFTFGAWLYIYKFCKLQKIDISAA